MSSASRILEIQISAADHRVVTANAEAWKLVEDNVFFPIEKYLTDESTELFHRKLAERDSGWFSLRFRADPEVMYLGCFSASPEGEAPESEAPEGEAAGREESATPVLHIRLVRPDQIMPEYLRADREAGSLASMLSLTGDVFFDYTPDTGEVCLFNTEQSRFSAGVRSYGDFERELQAACDPSCRQELDSFLTSLQGETLRFSVFVSCNLYNDDASISATLLFGTVAWHSDRRRSVIGRIHPRRRRNESGGSAYDPLTGLMDKEHITRLIHSRISGPNPTPTTLAILDVDYFKHVNDRYGHRYGDEVLRGVAAMIVQEVGSHGAAGRIGGDEFCIVLDQTDLQDVRAGMRSLKSLINLTFEGKGPREGTPISVSIGTASFPRDADNYDDLFMMADFCLSLAKEKGRNRYIHYVPEKHPPLEEIRRIRSEGTKNLVNGRDDLPLGDALAQMQYLVRYGTPPPPASLLSEFANRFRFPLVMLFAEDTPGVLRLAAYGGDKQEKLSEEAQAVCCSAFAGVRSGVPNAQGFTVVNHVDRLEDEFADARAALLKLNIRSFISIPFTDAAGTAMHLVLAALQRDVFFNEQHFFYYRLFADELARYTL